jgi:predicted DNA-binding transcriptional regulator AlpA
VTSRLLTTREVAEILSLSPTSVLRRWRTGDIPGFRLSSNVLRFDLGDIERYLDERRVGATASTIRPVEH